MKEQKPILVKGVLMAGLKHVQLEVGVIDVKCKVVHMLSTGHEVELER